MTSDVKGAELLAMSNEIKEAMLVTWLPPEEVRKLGDLSKVSTREATKIVNEWRAGKRRSMGKRPTSKPLPDVYYDVEQRTISAEEFEKWNNQGYQWRRDLPGGKMIIGLPGK
jgi:hypothetical protein